MVLQYINTIIENEYNGYDFVFRRLGSVLLFSNIGKMIFLVVRATDKGRLRFAVEEECWSIHV